MDNKFLNVKSIFCIHYHCSVYRIGIQEPFLIRILEPNDFYETVFSVNLKHAEQPVYSDSNIRFFLVNQTYHTANCETHLVTC